MGPRVEKPGDLDFATTPTVEPVPALAKLPEFGPNHLFGDGARQYDPWDPRTCRVAN